MKDELKLRLDSLRKQSQLTLETINDLLKRMDETDGEEDLKKSQKVLKHFLKFKGKIVIYQYDNWGTYIFKCKDIIPKKSKFNIPYLDFTAFGHIYKYDGINGRDSFQIYEGNVLSVGITSDIYERFQETKDWNYFDKMPVLKLIRIAQGVNNLLVESGINTNIEPE